MALPVLGGKSLIVSAVFQLMSVSQLGDNEVKDSGRSTGLETHASVLIFVGGGLELDMKNALCMLNYKIIFKELEFST